jgi:hypothetical protein
MCSSLSILIHDCFSLVSHAFKILRAVGKYNYFWMQIAVTLFSTFVTQPLDTIRRLQMLYAMDPRFIGQSGFMDVTKHIYATFGITGFFAGAGAFVFSYPPLLLIH